MRFLTMFFSVVLLTCLACTNAPVDNAAAEEQKAADAIEKWNMAAQATVENIRKAWIGNDAELLKANTTAALKRVTNGLEDIKDQAAYIETMAMFQSSFPDMNVDIGDYTFADNKVFIDWTWSGTNTGSFMGNDPTDKKAVIHGFSIWEFDDDGKAVLERAYFDNMSSFQQLGLPMPEPPAEDG